MTTSDYISPSQELPLAALVSEYDAQGPLEALVSLLGNISDGAWASSWNEDTAFVVWKAVQDHDISRLTGYCLNEGQVREMIAEARSLAEETQAWPDWLERDETVGDLKPFSPGVWLMPLALWRQRYEQLKDEKL